jgi:hypothetical protein
MYSSKTIEPFRVEGSIDASIACSSELGWKFQVTPQIVIPPIVVGYVQKNIVSSIENTRNERILIRTVFV